MAWAADELARKRPSNVVTLPVLNVSRGDNELLGRWSQPMGYPKQSPMFSYGLGTSGARGEPPHPDALVVEEAIGEVATTLATADCLLPTADLLHGLGFKKLDAQGALDAAAANVKNLLLVQGRLKLRPLIRLDPAFSVCAKLAENGKPGVWRREEWTEPSWQDHAPDLSRTAEVAVRAKRKNLYPAGAYCRIEYDPDPQMIVNERAEYIVWRAGLEALAENLHGRMENHVALPPAAAERPWMGERDGEMICNLFRPGAEGVYGGDEARVLQGDRASGRRRPVHGGATYSRRPTKPMKGVIEL